MNTHDVIVEKAQTLTDQQIMDAITEIDQQLAAVSPVRELIEHEGRTLRLVRAALYSTLEHRYPHTDHMMTAWAEDLNGNRTYTEALFDAIKAGA